MLKSSKLAGKYGTAHLPFDFANAMVGNGRFLDVFGLGEAKAHHFELGDVLHEIIMPKTPMETKLCDGNANKHRCRHSGIYREDCTIGEEPICY